MSSVSQKGAKGVLFVYGNQAIHYLELTYQNIYVIIQDDIVILIINIQGDI